MALGADKINRRGVVWALREAVAITRGAIQIVFAPLFGDPPRYLGLAVVIGRNAGI